MSNGTPNNEQIADLSQVELSVQGAGAVDSTGLFVAEKAAMHDFADKQVPVIWIGAAYRHQPCELDGESLLRKVSTIPKGTRSQAWMGPTDLHDYTIQADFLANEKNDKTPDMGLINQRYTLAVNSSQELQIRSWTSRLELRFAKTVPFAWQAGAWYTMKFQSENADGQAVLRGKVWPRGERSRPAGPSKRPTPRPTPPAAPACSATPATPSLTSTT